MSEKDQKPANQGVRVQAQRLQTPTTTGQSMICAVAPCI